MNNLTIADKYFLIAMDNFDYNMEEVVDNITYALGYDEYHAQSWCLQGRLMMTHLKNFTEAAKCFEMALLSDPQYIDTYKYYSLLLIWIGNVKKAEQVIKKSATVNGMSKSIIYQRWASLYEAKGMIDLALKALEKGELLSMCSDFQKYFNTEKQRLKTKVYKSKKKQKRKK